MQRRATQSLIVGILAGGHLHQRWARQEDLRLLLDHDHVVGQTGLIGAASGGGPEHHADGWDAQLGQFNHLVERAAALGEMRRLGHRAFVAGTAHAEIHAGGFDETA